MTAALQALYEQERTRLSRLARTLAAGSYEQPVFGEGPERPFLLLLGEAPGAEETRLGHPFVGKAGRQLDTLLGIAGIPREAVFITNVVKYRPFTRTQHSVRNRTPDKQEVLSSLPLLSAEVGLLGPACIATLGNVPLSAVLAIAGAEKRTVGEVHGRALELNVTGAACTLFPMYHPAGVLYNPALRTAMEEDAAALGRLCAAIKGL